uniref:Ribosome biogenesis protein NOP53 n=1 Tax=Clastoptera arizonana TaxID=38151 RepID=A0A1B6C459_9HEMI
MTDEGVQHILTNVGKFKVRHPRTFMREPKKYKSSLPSTEVPHPGISYNPSYTDHQNLLNEVAEKEIKQLKEEEHLKRTTTDLFSKVTADEKMDTWLTEMSSCLQPDDADDQDIDGDYRAINPPTSFDKKKTLKQRRKLKESKALELQRKMLQIEKKKVSDLYKLKLLTQELDKKDQKSARLQENRAQRKISMVNRTKRLNRNKFEEPDLVFKRKHEITGNLRSLEPEGNILLDRFYSMQRRNILPPTVKQNKTKKAKVKRYIKPGFRIDAAV